MSEQEAAYNVRAYAKGKGDERNPLPEQAARDRGRTWWLASCGHGVDYATYVNVPGGEICPNCAADWLAAMRISLLALASDLENQAIVGMGIRDIAKRLRDIAG